MSLEAIEKVAALETQMREQKAAAEAAGEEAPAEA